MTKDEYQLKRKIISARNTLDSQLKKLANKYYRDLKDNLEYIGRSSIDAFYEDYTPIRYARKYDLYNTYKIDININGYDVDCSIDFDYKYMKYHGNLKDYIYDISFLQGYHGGADEGEEHPEPGIPWWRDPRYDKGESPSPWLRRAVKSRSPYEYMYERMTDYINDWQKRCQEETLECFVEAYNKIEDAIITYNKSLEG